MVERAYKLLSISRQCELLGISRSAYYYTPQTLQDEEDFELLKKSEKYKSNIRKKATGGFTGI